MQRKLSVLFAATVVLFTWSAHSAAEIWHDVTPAQAEARGTAAVRYFQADDTALRTALADAPHETSGRLDRLLSIPMPDGSLALYSVQESPIMEAALAARYPQIKTFKIAGVDNPDARGRIDIGPLGFHGMIQTPAGRIFIDPDDFRLQNHVYRSRYDRGESRRPFNCGVEDHLFPASSSTASTARTASRIPGSLLEYRLAVAATLEYHQDFGSNPTNTTAAIVNTINRVNFVYERDHGIRLTLVANNDSLYETTDSGLDNEDALVLLGQVNGWIDANLPGGDGSYDIGHIFSRPAVFGGGVAFLGAVCDNTIKGGGVSGLPGPGPLGDPFDIDLVAHEIGHQFNATHSFNGTTSSCINRTEATAWEPGSGTSIMAYAGICAGENLASNSDASFHAGSIAQIHGFTAGAGAACATPIATVPAGNNDPVITGIADLTIPASTTIPANTPFVLDGTSSDADANPREYRWEQMNTGCPTDAASLGTDNGSNPLFRSYVPRSDSWRNFPALGTQVQGRYDDAEVLPCQNRTLDFRLTVTDGFSGQDVEDVSVTVTNAAGPFEVTGVTPTPIIAGQNFTVTWDVAGTSAAPVNCSNVDIDLLAFAAGYSTYTVHSLGTNLTNNGSATVALLPSTSTHPRVRIRVKCSTNIFYDISDTDLTLNQLTNPPVTLNDTARSTQFYANAAITDFTAPVCGAVVNCSPAPTGSSDSGGSKNGDASAFEAVWLMLLSGLALLRRCRRI